MPAPNSRQTALRILRHWKPDGMFAEDMIDLEARVQSLSGPNRALLNAVVLGVVRNRSLLDFWIDHLRDGGKLQREARELLRMGLVQILLMDLPEHAAVNETVELAGPAKSLANAILRRAVRSRSELQTMAEQAPPSVRWSLPEFLLQRWRNNFGPKACTFLCEWINRPSPIHVRGNNLRFRGESRAAHLPGAVPVEGFPGFFQVPELPLGLLEEGICYAQDPSTALAPALLAAQRHETILDACAAPGGKSAMLAQAMGNHGQILCVDQSEKRVKRLAGNLRRLNVRCAEVLQHDWLAGPLPDYWRQRFPGGFDGILIDAPCSNTGVMRRRVDVRWRLKPDAFAVMQEQQGQMLNAVAPHLKPGGRLVYSTCSIEPEENEGTVQKFTASHPEFQLAEMQRTLPHRDGVDGGFAALLIRQ
ncbi:MAG: methyltransferase domain-containing protein [Verrucomicrobiales bacterium]|nr:methyltransferase domain-containing protein [Verrucomicrobiales bacterium]